MAPHETNSDRESGGEPARRHDGQPDAERVALVIHRLGLGGGERVVAHLAGRLSARRIGTLVVCLGDKGQLAEEVELAGVTVAAIGSNTGYDLRAIFRLGRLLREFRPAVINCHDRSSMPYVVLANWISGRRPIVYSAHGLLFNADREPRLRHRLAMRGVSMATAVSEEVARRHADYLAWREGFDIIPNGVPTVARSPQSRAAVRRELGASEGDFVFLAVGNARPEKGFEDLLDAAAAIRNVPLDRRVLVWVAGAMPDTPYCRSLLGQRQRLGLQNTVRFLGYRPDVHCLYSAADAFVLSSRSEGLPMVVLEAMTAELPVIATRVGGVPNAIPDGTGLLVEPASPAALAQSMVELCRDTARRLRLGERARQHAIANYGVEKMASSYLDAYSRMLSRKARSHRRRQT